MIGLSPAEIRGRCDAIVSALSSSQFDVSVVPTRSVIGGGTTPGARLKSFAVALRHCSLSAGALATALRGFNTPVVARLNQERLLLDLRTVEPEMDATLVGLSGILARASGMLSETKSVVIGTGGHIDHGKTEYVRALTGIDTDRLPEEKRRGITIDFGSHLWKPAP